MSNFLKYQHIERLGTPGVEGLLDGVVYIFPKLDGTNASVWLDEKGTVCYGSRNRQLSLSKDNAGFMNHFESNENEKANLIAAFQTLGDVVIYGEWLVPHQIKEYQEQAWRNFYVFDVYSRIDKRWLMPEEYVSIKPFLPLIPAYEIYNFVSSGTADFAPLIEKLLQHNRFLMQEGCVGEGLVIKNYGYRNRFGDTIWGKIVCDEFLKNKKGYRSEEQKRQRAMVESKIVEMFVTDSLIQKEWEKIRNSERLEGWHPSFYPRMFETIFHEIVIEEIWNIVKKFKNPTIDFNLLRRRVTDRIKEAIETQKVLGE